MGLQLLTLSRLLLFVELEGFLDAVDIIVVNKVDCLTYVEAMRKPAVVGLNK